MNTFKTALPKTVLNCEAQSESRHENPDPVKRNNAENV